MANEQPIKHFSSADIAAYHQGKLSPAEMHAIEKAALEDPLLADALEGYMGNLSRLPADLEELQKKLTERIAEVKEQNKVFVLPRKNYSWLKIAAIFILLAGGGLLVYQLGFNSNKNNPIANEQSAPVKEEKISRDISPVSPDSIAGNNTAVLKDEIAVAKPAETPVSPHKDQTPGSTLQNGAASNIPADKTDQQTAPVNTIKEGKTEDIALQKQAAANAEKQDQLASENAAAARSREMEVRRKSAFKSESRPATTENRDNKPSNYSVATDTYKLKENIASFNVFRGRVTDEANNPLPFVNITNRVDNVGTYSDANGNFTMIFPDSVLNVNVRSVGYSNKNTRLIHTARENQIIMQDDRTGLNEVVLNTKKINSKSRENNMVLEEPVPADGWSKYDTYLANNLSIPETFEDRKISGGEVQLSFEINRQGEPVNIKVEKSLCEICDREAIRALKEGPRWKRKAKNGRASVTITF